MVCVVSSNGMNEKRMRLKVRMVDLVLRVFHEEMGRSMGSVVVLGPRDNERLGYLLSVGRELSCDESREVSVLLDKVKDRAFRRVFRFVKNQKYREKASREFVDVYARFLPM